MSPASAPAPPLPPPSRRGWPSPAAVLQAEIVEPGLQAREWVLAPHEGRAHAFLVVSRRARIEVDGRREDLAAPALAWLPATSSGRLRLEAGARAAALSVEDDFVLRAVSTTAEAGALRRTLARPTIVGAADLGDRTTEIAQSFRALARELREADRASFAFASAHLTLVCLSVWRLSAEARPAERGLRGTGSRVLESFLALVEQHFRDHWSVAAYADELGVSEDRLHAICRRGTGKAPSIVVRDRVILEACGLLAGAETSVEQVAYALGFRDPNYFSRLFRKALGVPPGSYRREARSRRAPASFAAWP